MNAGAFGGETGGRVAWVDALDRAGSLRRLGPGEIGFAYRRSSLPADWIVTRAAFRTVAGDPGALLARMDAIRAEREAAQPLRVATGGSTFKNPDGGRKAWRLIDAAGCRGLRLGGAVVSEKHCNFLVNTGTATASDVEELGELVRRRVLETQGVRLEWEIHRVGRPLAPVQVEAAA
jgi:UDP-N-acetylmuramate dehydrogenase